MALLPLAAAAIALQSWGSGVLNGHGPDTGLAPVTIPGTPVAVVVGEGAQSTTYALTSAGAVYGWGYDDCGQLGTAPSPDPVLAPVRVGGLPQNITNIAGGEGFALALARDGQVWAWGRDDLGQLGDTTTTTTTCTNGAAARPAPAPVALPVAATSIAAGTGHALASTATAVYGWGFNGSGQLGRADGFGGTDPQPPGPMDLPPGTQPQQVAAGNQYSLVRTATGALSSGIGFSGQLGNGDYPGSGTATPQTVQLAGTPTDIVAGEETGLAILADRTVQTWGRGDFGQRGDGSTDLKTSVPATVPGLSNIVGAALYFQNGLAVRSDGAVLGWGDQGALNGAPTSTTPIRVPGVDPAVPSRPAVADGAGFALTAVQPTTGETALAAPVRGVVRIKPPNGRFARLTTTRLIPMGSLVDVRRGAVQLTTTEGAGTEHAVFDTGLFKLGQRRTLTTLRLIDRFTCAAARTAADKPRHNRLWGNGKGHYKVTGHDGATSVKGTHWLTEDRCDGTFVQVRSGTVAVRDFGRHRTVLVHAGDTYLARRRP